MKKKTTINDISIFHTKWKSKLQCLQIRNISYMTHTSSQQSPFPRNPRPPGASPLLPTMHTKTLTLTQRPPALAKPSPPYLSPSCQTPYHQPTTGLVNQATLSHHRHHGCRARPTVTHLYQSKHEFCEGRRTRYILISSPIPRSPYVICWITGVDIQDEMYGRRHLRKESCGQRELGNSALAALLNTCMHISR